MSQLKLLKQEIEGLKAEIESLKINRISMAQRIRELEKYVDTVSSPFWKRILFIFQGWKYNRLGRWYKAPWNKVGKNWE